MRSAFFSLISVSFSSSDTPTLSDVPKINAAWKYSSTYSSYTLNWSITHKKSACIRRKSDNEAVAWFMREVDGSLGKLHVADEYHSLLLALTILSGIFLIFLGIAIEDSLPF